MDDRDRSYEFVLRLLGNEVFALGFKSSTTSNKWLAIGLFAMFLVLLFLVIHGEALIKIFT